MQGAFIPSANRIQLGIEWESMGKVRFISSKNNDFIIETAKLKQKKYRDEKKIFFVEGIKLFKEALSSDYRGKIKHIIIEESIFEYIIGKIKEITGINQSNIIQEFDIVTVTREVYVKITEEEAFQGVMCIIEKMPEKIALNYDKPVIILDSVRDPGNVGTVIRTAAAVGDFDIILSDDCADIYGSKTQRAAMGAIFRQNIKITENKAIEIEILKKNGYNIFAAHLKKNPQSIDEVMFTKKTAVIFGNEGNGLDDSIADLCDEKIIIPINQNSESLNVSVAAGIIMWEIKKSIKHKTENKLK